MTAYDYGFRIYNPAIARFLSVDPLTKSYPWYTPYQFAGNKPTWAIDLDGLEETKPQISGGITLKLKLTTHLDVKVGGFLSMSSNNNKFLFNVSGQQNGNRKELSFRAGWSPNLEYTINATKSSINGSVSFNGNNIFNLNTSNFTGQSMSESGTATNLGIMGDYSFTKNSLKIGIITNDFTFEPAKLDLTKSLDMKGGNIGSLPFISPSLSLTLKLNDDKGNNGKTGGNSGGGGNGEKVSLLKKAWELPGKGYRFGKQEVIESVKDPKLQQKAMKLGFDTLKSNLSK